MSRQILGQSWYYYLLPQPQADDGRTKIGLFSVANRDQVQGKLVVCLESSDGTKHYSLFNTYADYFLYSLNFDPDYRSFYEVIMGELPQKPHFDIDLKMADYPGVADIATFGEQLLDSLIEAVVGVITEDLKENICLSTDIMAFTSHGASKRSYHVVVNGKAHTDNKAAKSFYIAVMQRITHPGRDAIDPGVYSAVQQFRMLGSQKAQSGRPKIHMEKIRYRGEIYSYTLRSTPRDEQHKNFMLLADSLVSNTIMCSILPNPWYQEKKWQATLGDGTTAQSMRGISDEDAIAAVKLLAHKAGLTPDAPLFPYDMGGLKDGVIILKRRAASECPICHRVHENENPFLVVSGDSVYFNCRRSVDGKSLYIGSLSSLPPEVLARSTIGSDGDPSIEIVEEEDVGNHTGILHLPTPEMTHTESSQVAVGTVALPWNACNYVQPTAQSVIDTIPLLPDDMKTSLPLRGKARAAQQEQRTLNSGPPILGNLTFSWRVD